jgi:hypothetical protein
MAINIDTQDLVSYPGNIKRVVIDQTSVVPTSNEGDETFMLSFTTAAYSNNTDRTRIQTSYVTGFKSGWSKSSGFTGTSYALDSTHNSIEVKIDSTTSGIDSGYYRLTLDHNNGIPIDAIAVAKNIEEKLKEVAENLASVDLGYKLAYLNSSVQFIGSRLYIVSGSLGEYYTGASRSSVRVRPSLVNDCSEILGFNLPTESEEIDGMSIKEALVLTTISGMVGTQQITINQNVGAVINDCMLITNGVDTEYFQITNVTDGIYISLDASVLSHVYLASKSKVQLLRLQDPDAGPALWFDNIDKVTRHGIKSMMNQIDYSL